MAQASIDATLQALGLAGDAAEALIGEVRDHIREFNKHAGILDSLKAFIAAVDWQERWIQALLACHASLLLLVLLLRKSQAFQAAVFFGLMLAIWLAERLNALGAAHWRSFAGQPYFDEHGIFVSAIYSAPLLLIMFIILVNFLVRTSEMLIAMKKRQLRYELRMKARREAAEAGTGADAGASAHAAAPAAVAPGEEEGKKDQ